MPDVSSLLSSWKARENDAFPLPCLEGVVLQEKTDRTIKRRITLSQVLQQLDASSGGGGSVVKLKLYVKGVIKFQER